MRQRAVHRKNRRSAVSYVSTGLARLPRDTSGTRNYRRRVVVEMPRTIATYIVAERRHFSVTRYAERILPISRAGGTPLPMAGRLTQLAKIFPVIYTTALRR